MSFVKFRTPVVLLLSFTLTCALPSVYAEDDREPLDLDTLKTKVEAAAKVQQMKIEKEMGSLISKLKAAGKFKAKAEDMYIEGLEKIKFVGDSARAKAWQKSNKVLLKGSEFSTANKLFYNWAALTVRHAIGESVEDLMPEIIEHWEEATDSNMDDILQVHEAKDLLTQKWDRNMHWKALEVDHLLERVQNGWVLEAGNSSAILTKLILPHMRKNPSDEILKVWDHQIKSEEKLAKNGSGGITIDMFNETRYPELFWKRSRDRMHLDFLGALNDMFYTLEDFPTHPEAVGWMDELKSYLSKSEEEAKAESIQRNRPNHKGTL